jgi:hypothetical protein
MAGQAVAGYLSYQPTGPTYELPIEHALVLAAASPAYVVGVGEIVAGQYATLTELESAFRGDGGVDYSRFPHTLSTASSGSSAPPTDTSSPRSGSRRSRASSTSWPMAPGCLMSAADTAPPRC